MKIELALKAVEAELSKVRSHKGHEKSVVFIMVHTIDAKHWKEALEIKKALDTKLGKDTVTVVPCPFATHPFAIGIGIKQK